MLIKSFAQRQAKRHCKQLIEEYGIQGAMIMTLLENNREAQRYMSKLSKKLRTE